jgi:hypothetical protein
MINWLKEKIVGWARNDMSESKILKYESYSVDNDQKQLKSTPMTFYLYTAEGGSIIETSYYDEKKDDWNHRLYIIPENENFTTALDQIVSIERLKSWH